MVNAIFTGNEYDTKMVKNDDRNEGLWRRAYELARSGKFPSWITIEWELRFNEDCPEAREMLEDPFIRAELDELCDQARQPL
jgi:hypothetical protein